MNLKTLFMLILIFQLKVQLKSFNIHLLVLKKSHEYLNISIKFNTIIIIIIFIFQCWYLKPKKELKRSWWVRCRTNDDDCYRTSSSHINHCHHLHIYSHSSHPPLSSILINNGKMWYTWKKRITKESSRVVNIITAVDIF